MAKRSRMSVLKRQREARKAEKAALKRERREQRKAEGPQEVSSDDLSGYFDDGQDAPEEEEEQVAESEADQAAQR